MTREITDKESIKTQKNMEGLYPKEGETTKRERRKKRRLKYNRETTGNYKTAEKRGKKKIATRGMKTGKYITPQRTDRYYNQVEKKSGRTRKK